jgi:hypothetical protein
VFYGFDFMDAARYVAARQDFWGQAWLHFEEPNLDLSQLEFQKLVARTTVKFVQASRFLGVNALFPLPKTRLFNSGIMEVAQVRVKIFGESPKYRYGRVEEIKPNEYGTSPRFFFPRMGYLKVFEPPRQLIDLYEVKRKQFHDEYFSVDKIQAIKTREAAKLTKKSHLEYVNYVMAHVEDKNEKGDWIFKNEKGELSWSKIQSGPKGEWDLPNGTATRVKNAVVAKLT